MIVKNNSHTGNTDGEKVNANKPTHNIQCFIIFIFCTFILYKQKNRKQSSRVKEEQVNANNIQFFIFFLFTNSFYINKNRKPSQFA